MEIAFTERAQNDLKYWRDINDAKIQERISVLLKSIMETPFTGIGKPEPLRYDLSGYWSRRISKEHRLVYGVQRGIITVISLRFHY